MKQPTKPTCGVCACATVVRIDVHEWQQLRPGEWAYDHGCGTALYAVRKLQGVRVTSDRPKAGPNEW